MPELYVGIPVTEVVAGGREIGEMSQDSLAKGGPGHHTIVLVDDADAEADVDACVEADGVGELLPAPAIEVRVATRSRPYLAIVNDIAIVRRYRQRRRRQRMTWTLREESQPYQYRPT